MYTRPEGRVYLSSRVTGRGSRSARANSSKIVSLGCIGPDLVGPGAASAGACIQVNSGAAPAQRVQRLDAAMTGRLRCPPPTAALGDQCRAGGKKGLTLKILEAIVLGFSLEGFPSGQRDQTVNLTALPSKVRILPPPPAVFCVANRRFLAAQECGGS